MIIDALSGTSGASSRAPSPGTTTTTPGLIDKNMFLQLLVAQLKNQDPLNPTDSTAFVGQLAQFQQLEQSINTGQDIAAMRQDLDLILAGGNSSGSVSQS